MGEWQQLREQQACIEARVALWEAALDSVQKSLITITQDFDQADSETKCEALHVDLGDVKRQGRRSATLPAVERQATANVQTGLEKRCCILEARLDAQIE